MMILVAGVGLAAVAALGGVLVVGRRARRREASAAAEAATHPHYCAECDQEWMHTGQTCLYSWASVCPKCARATAATPPEAAAIGSQA
jgi:hypothetical protein